MRRILRLYFELEEKDLVVYMKQRKAEYERRMWARLEEEISRTYAGSSEM